MPCTVAFVASGLLVVADGLASVMGSWDTPAPGLWWLKIAAIGHGVLAVSSVALLCAGISRASWRRAAAITAWTIVPVGVAGLLLAGRLASG